MKCVESIKNTEPQTKDGIELSEHRIVNLINSSIWGHLSLADISLCLNIEYTYATRICCRLVNEGRLSRFKHGRRVFYSINK